VYANSYFVPLNGPHLTNDECLLLFRKKSLFLVDDLSFLVEELTFLDVELSFHDEEQEFEPEKPLLSYGLATTLHGAKLRLKTKKRKPPRCVTTP
jgi:hypothetical protein